MNRTDEPALRVSTARNTNRTRAAVSHRPPSPVTATDSRRRIEKILNGEDPSTGRHWPCSIFINDPNAAMEYARRSPAQRQKHQARLEQIVMHLF